MIHDDSVERTTDGSGFVRDMSLREVRSLDAGYRFTPDGGASYPYRGQGVRVPELREVFDQFPDRRLNVDIKEVRPGTEQALLQVIGDAGAEDRTLVVSEESEIVDNFRELSGGRIPTGASWREIEDFYYLSSMSREGTLHPPYDALQIPSWHEGMRVVTPRFIEAAHDRGVRVDVWTIDDPEEMRHLLDLGVDVIMTNRPEVLAEVLRERR